MKSSKKKKENTNISSKRANPYEKKISELTKINEKLCDKIVVIEVQNIVLKNKIKSLNKFIKDNGGEFRNLAEERSKAWKKVKKARSTIDKLSNSEKSLNRFHN